MMREFAVRFLRILHYMHFKREIPAKFTENDLFIDNFHTMDFVRYRFKVTSSVERSIRLDIHDRMVKLNDFLKRTGIGESDVSTPNFQLVYFSNDVLLDLYNKTEPELLEFIKQNMR